MGKVIAIGNQKGGSGKTTTTRSLGSALAEMGKRTLLVDMDPQASLSEGCGFPPHLLERTTYHALLGVCHLADTIVALDKDLDLAPTNLQLSAAEVQLISMSQREGRLRDAVKPAREHYDYILIDCPPSFGLLTINTLVAADSVLIPMTCDYYTMLGVGLMLEAVRGIQAGVNSGLQVEGILPTRFDSRTIHAKRILAQAKAAFGDDYKVYDIIIYESVKLKECPASGKSILEYAGSSREAMAYREVAREIVNGQSR